MINTPIAIHFKLRLLLMKTFGTRAASASTARRASSCFSPLLCPSLLLLSDLAHLGGRLLPCFLLLSLSLQRLSLLFFGGLCFRASSALCCACSAGRRRCCCSSAIVRSMAAAISENGASWFGHSLTGLPSFGTTCRLPSGVLCHRQGRR